MINFTTETVNLINYRHLETLIEKTYGIKKFNIACEEEIDNGSYIKGTANPEHLDAYDKERIASKDTMYMTQTYINDLARQGLFPKGEYVVKVSW